MQSVKSKSLPVKLQKTVIISVWAAAMAVATFLLLNRIERGGAGGYLALGICGVMWTIFLARLLAWNNSGTGAEKRVLRWLVVSLLALTLAALLVLFFSCIAHGQYTGAGVTLLFVFVLLQALREITRRTPERRDRRDAG